MYKMQKYRSVIMIKSITTCDKWIRYYFSIEQIYDLWMWQKCAAFQIRNTHLIIIFSNIEYWIWMKQFLKYENTKYYRRRQASLVHHKLLSIYQIISNVPYSSS